MSSHAHRFAHVSLPEAVFDNPVAFARTLASERQGLQLLGSIWDAAGATIPAIDRVARQGLAARLEQRGPFVVIHVAVPPPRGVGDPAMVAILGRGDGQTKLDTVAYYILELDLDPTTRSPRFIVAARTPSAYRDESRYVGEGPAPDPRWFADHVCALWANKVPPAPTGLPTVPAWYWWHVFRGAELIRTWVNGRDDLASQLERLQREPLLLLPELAEAAELFVGPMASGLRRFQRALRYEQAFAGACRAAATQLANANVGTPAANLSRALALISDAREYGTELPKSYAVEAMIRAKLAAIGVDPHTNYEEAGRLDAMARGEHLAGAAQVPHVQPFGPSPALPPTQTEAEQPRRFARGTEAPAAKADQTWTSLFLETAELPFYTRLEDRRTETANDPTFVACGGLHVGYVAWAWGGQRVIDSRWLFPTAAAAEQYLHTMLPVLADNLPGVPAPSLGDTTYAFGARGTGQVLIFRVGRMIAKLAVAEAPNTVLDQAMIVPLALRAAARANLALARYWLFVGRGTDAAVLFAQNPTPRLIAEYPILAHPEFPAAMATMGEGYARSAQALWDLQTRLRTTQWQVHRETTRLLVRTLLDDRDSEPRVNAAHASAIVAEIRSLDADPIWAQLAAECRARG